MTLELVYSAIKPLRTSLNRRILDFNVKITRI